jgi:hypothetical protein
MSRAIASDPGSRRRAAQRGKAGQTPGPEAAPAVPAPKAANTVTFRAELDLTEIDTRGRPGTMWTGRAMDISRSSLAFRSRRMCYEGRELVLAVHLVDDRPVPLYGMVSRCEYDGDGLYKTSVNLLPMPQTEGIRAWVNGLHHRPVL